MPQARTLRDMNFVHPEIRGEMVTLAAGTVLDVIPASEVDICAAADSLFERKALMRWLKKNKPSEPSTILIRWENKLRYATLGADVEYLSAVPTAPPRRPDPEPTDAPRELPEWAKLKE